VWKAVFLPELVITSLSLSTLRTQTEMKAKKPNGPMELIPVPAALLARRLRSRLWCQKQAGIAHRGR